MIESKEAEIKPSRSFGEPIRDGFAVSRLFRLRRTLKRNPYRFLLYLVPLVLGWTVLMSYGASIYGSNRFLVQYSPSIAGYTVILGMFIYPVRHVWIPILLYMGMLAIPFGLPFSGTPPEWRTLASEWPWVTVVVMAANLTSGLVTGFSANAIYRRFRAHMSPYAADLVLALAAQMAFLVTNLTMALFFDGFLRILPSVVQAYAGYDEHYFGLAALRILRGCTVLLVFFMAFMHKPAVKDAIYAVPTVLAFMLLAAIHRQGWTGESDVEASILGIFFALLLPTRAAPMILIISVALYASLTGTYLDDMVHIGRNEVFDEIYGVLLLLVVGYILAVRGYADDREQTTRASNQRLDAARDFAGVGIFVVNQRTGIIQLDKPGMRLMGTDKEFSTVQEIYDRFAPESRHRLQKMGIVEAGESYEHVLRVTRDGDDERMARVYVWGERSDSGAALSFGLVVDITEQYFQETDLRHALKELEARDEKQRRMFSIISHEIRTPASVISMLAEDLHPDTAEHIRPRLMEASNQLLGVLSDMRQAVNPEQNLAVRPVPYIPAELAETVRNTYQAQADKNRIALKVTLGEKADMRRIGDQARLKQLIGNLVRNAIIHSRGRNIEIKFDCHHTEDGTIYSDWSVSDDGIGIKPDEVDRLFEPFERGKKDPRTQADGSGLGLYIVKSAVELLGGTISYIQRKRGASYLISVPEPLAGEDVDEPVDLSALPDILPLDVLLVEDNALVADVMIARLGKRFASVSLARNGVEALYLIEANEPDVLLTDLFMPQMEGDALIRQLKGRGAKFRMFGLTAAAVGNDIDRFIDAGAEAVFTKPLDMNDLMTKLTN